MLAQTLKSNATVEIQKRRFGPVERLVAAKKIQEVCNFSYPAFFAIGIKTMFSGEDSALLWTQTNNAPGAVRSIKGI
jgi:hypothetical protein